MSAARRALLTPLVAACLLLTAAGVGAASPAEGARPAGDVPRDEDGRPLKRVEPGVFPGTAYNSDLGVGAGVVFNIAGIEPGYDPYRWLVDGQIFLYLKGRAGGGVRVTDQYHYVNLDLPRLAGDRLRLRFRLFFIQQANAAWFGLGNGSVAEEPWLEIDPDEDPEAWAAARGFHEYDRISPGGRAEARIRLPADLFVLLSLEGSYSRPTLTDGTRLALDRAGASGDWVQEQLATTATHGVLTLTGGLILDTRDSEIRPTRGMFHELSIRGGPTLGVAGAYGGANLTARFYLPLRDDWLVFASRWVVDLLWGKPTFWELNRFGGTQAEDALGGTYSMRGPPEKRYAGRIKAFANLELRSELLRTKIKRTPASLGLILFADVGRVWADWRPRPELDGPTPGLKLGLGAGVRASLGEVFVLRMDAGWSPDGFGVYVDTFHLF